MSEPVRFVRISFDCCGRPDTVAFDIKARAHWRTWQCPTCHRVLEIARPIVLDRGPDRTVGDRPIHATGESPKEDPR